MASDRKYNVDMAACRASFLDREEKKLARHEHRRRLALEAVKLAAADVLPDYPCVQRAYVFGSVVRKGAFRPDSDIDVAVEGVASTEYFTLWREMEEHMPEWAIDLRDLVAGTHFARRVKESGQLIYEREGTTSKS